MYSYTVSKVADVDLFIKACKLIETNMDSAVKDKPLIDVDGSVFQKYTVKEYIIVVSNDYYIDAVYVDSEMDLYELFNNEQFKDLIIIRRD